MKRMEVTAQRLLADPFFTPLKVYLIQSTGLAYYGDKDADLAERVARRLGVVGLRDCGSYLELLKEGDAGHNELDALIEDLTIGETFFFRHREMFDALRDLVLPDLIARNSHSRRLHIWSAGCSVGAEPYSLSILLRRDLAAQVAGWDLRIVGTDINRDFLARGRSGVFDEWALRSIPDELRRACFAPAGQSWVIAPEYRQGVSFQYHNLLTHPFPSLLNDLCGFDLILCRNVTIYFSTDIVRRIVGHFHQCLVEGGWLAVGHAEPNLELFRAFRTVNAPGAVLYQKRAEQAAVAAALAEPWEWCWSPDPVPPPAAAPVPTWTPPRLPPEPVAADPVLPALPQLDRGPALPFDVQTIRALADRGAWAEAAHCCEEVLANNNLSAVVHFYHGLVLEQMGQHTEAGRALRRALYLDRNYILAHYYLGLLLQQQGQLAQAARSFTNVLALLERIDPGKVFDEGDGITAGELKQLTQMHLDVLEKA